MNTQVGVTYRGRGVGRNQSLNALLDKPICERIQSHELKIIFYVNSLSWNLHICNAVTIMGIIGARIVIVRHKLPFLKGVKGPYKTSLSTTKNHLMTHWTVSLILLIISLIYLLNVLP